MSGRQRSGTSGFWSGFILGVVGLLAMIMVVCAASLLLSAPPDSDVTLPQLDTVALRDGPLAGASIVRYLGPISPAGVALLVERLKQLPKDRPRWISLETGGGDVPAATALVEYVNANDIGVAVAKNKQCASAWVTVFAQATRRLASDDAYFGFHYRKLSGLLFNFDLFKFFVTYEHDSPMTADLVPLTRDIANPPADLAGFFGSCRNGNPTYSHKVTYLSWRQITAIVQGEASPGCDDIVGQDAHWLEDRIAPLH